MYSLKKFEIMLTHLLVHFLLNLHILNVLISISWPHSKMLCVLYAIVLQKPYYKYTQIHRYRHIDINTHART